MDDIEDCLSAEEIEAATRKIVVRYYACYDSIGNITSVTNTLPADDYLQIPYATFEKFVSGKELFKDWVVNKTKTSANDTGIELVPRYQQAITFRNNMFEWIREEPTADTEVFVHWDWFNKKWLFYISPEAKTRVYNAEVGSKTLTFFVSYEHNFEQLLRIIEISVYDLLRTNVEIPFIYDLERNIDGINLSTKSVFTSYGLKIWREIKE